MAIIKPERPTTALAETYQRFWQGFNDAAKGDEAFCREFTLHPFGSTRSYQDYYIGEPYHIVVGINFKKHEIRVGAYFRDLDAYDFYFQHNKSMIEERIGRKLKWTKHQTKGSAYIYDSADFDETHGWEKAYDTMIGNMLTMLNAFVIVPKKPVNDLD